MTEVTLTDENDVQPLSTQRPPRNMGILCVLGELGGSYGPGISNPQSPTPIRERCVQPESALSAG